MSRQTRGAAKKFLVLLLTALVAFTGCHPTQPFYLFEKGDLQHYVDTATKIEYPDIDQAVLAEAAGSKEPLTIINPHFDEFWDLTLEEAICIAMKNSKVIRSLGVGQSTNVRSLADILPDRLLSAPEAARTVYEPGIVESNPGGLGRGTGISNPSSGQFSARATPPGRLNTNGEAGVEAALAAFDARFEMGSFFDNTNQRQNSVGNPFTAGVLQQDNWRNYVQFSKRTATGLEVFARTLATYSSNNNPIFDTGTGQNFRLVPSDWLANLEVEARQPLLRGAGTQINRMNVMVARINTDRSLADFELSVRNLVFDVERAYWDLSFQYRNLETQKIARDSALVSWKKIKTKQIVSVPGGEAEKEAQARQQYFRFRSQVEAGLKDVFQVENRLRYMLGLTASDGRMIRPSDEPVTAKVDFDFCQILSESLFRSVELRRQKWQIKRRELELITARNGLLPTLDAVALYRWLGRGDTLIEADRNGQNFAGNQADPFAVPPIAAANTAPGSVAWDELTEGKFQEYSVGIQFEMPLGFRQELAGVRWAQLSIAREKAVLEEMELELTHTLAAAYQDLEAHYHLVQTNYNWRVAAQKEVDAVLAAYEAGTVTLDLLLRAQQSRAEAETEYYRSLKDYNMSIASVHLRKGSLLEYNHVLLAEGPWPGKAYFDAMGHARRRDASHYLNYGYTRPRVMSQGTYNQFEEGSGSAASGMMDPLQFESQGQPLEEIAPGAEVLESPPVPQPEAGDAGFFPIPPRAPAATATRPTGPQLAPPLLRSAGGPARPARPIGAGVGQGSPAAFDWGVIESNLDANPRGSAKVSSVIRASHAAAPNTALRISDNQPVAAASPVKVRLSQPKSAASNGWQAIR